MCDHGAALRAAHNLDHETADANAATDPRELGMIVRRVASVDDHVGPEPTHVDARVR